MPVTSRVSLECSALFGALLTIAGCCGRRHEPPLPPPILDSWGGEHLGLIVNSGGAALEFDCAHGQIEKPLTIDPKGYFLRPGVFVREHGGPDRPGEIPDSHPAVYSGRVNGNNMALTVKLVESGHSVDVGTFQLTQGMPPHIVKCK